MIFSTVKDNVRQNLNDAGITYFSDPDIADSCQDAYDDVSCLSQNIVKKTVVNFQDDLNYYDLKELGVADYIQTTAIFSNVSNLWLKDNKTRKDFDLIRPDSENWYGNPVWWAPVGLGSKYIQMMPKMLIGTGDFTLYYWAQAPTIVNSDTPLIAIDYVNLIEYYSTADLLEQAEEYVKASNYWKLYYDNLVEYSTRTKNLAKSDLLMLA